LENKTDKQLVSMCKRGNRAAFDELVRRNQSYFKSWILKYCKGNNSLGEEIYSQTLIKSWQKIKTFKGDCAFKTWFCAIANRNFLDEYRKNKKYGFIELEKCINLSADYNRKDNSDNAYQAEININYNKQKEKLPSFNIESSENFKENNLLIDRVLRKLKPNHREVLRMHHRDGMEYKEISKRLKIPLGTVMSRLYYARIEAVKIVKKYKYTRQ
jgi:RNA polymerase sigma-70 factor (ECF subfamily)